ncbi:site-specific recombinase [Methylophilus medardicus]|uniref:Preprotein translocase subunit TatB n=1 Tax=Methylophilus medardicus TaxID=2588534 RepID=A0A5B8CR37_9PROT|nr:site-specific recombinase [Methylophilus medardicus]QDC43718.1 preprotein translocase subunit TatB [Methylophilus medardicus]QDC48725.1 preprotein translocase subunit TatB [Methylophilus medardicus]QDC52430.1 preprotein translocase subunit TatB [Methylophilus medardicus]
MFQHTFDHQAAREAASDIDDIAFLKALFDDIRPKVSTDIESASKALQALCFLLQQHPQYAASLRNSLFRLLDEKSIISLYSDHGIQSDLGFFTEIYRRLSHKLLPEVPDPKYLKDVFGQIFHDNGDTDWVCGMPETVWQDFMRTLAMEQGHPQQQQNCIQELKDALQVLSYRLSASGLDPELILQHEDLESNDSPFITQNIEIQKFLALSAVHAEDVQHLYAVLKRCEQLTHAIRKANAKTGTSISLTALMQRILQQIQRMQLLVDILHGLILKHDVSQAITRLLKQLVDAECKKNNLSDYWRQNTELLALRVTENASHTGEHYIAQHRGEYYKLMGSAMGAGMIIALMAMIKIIIAGYHLAPLTEAILFSLNYGIGFVIIHLLHFTVATKQPAMTAATIAASIDDHGHDRKNIHNLVNIVAQTTSSQTIAILGNVVVVIPVAILIDWLIMQMTGHHFIGADKAHFLLDNNNPLISLTVLYAAVAGVCLFLSGLIAGYHDNLAAYNRIPERLSHLRWLQTLFGKQRLWRITEYIRHNLGALAGNFYFGCLLGFASGLGVMLGMPLDIRHVTFVAAFSGYALPALDFQVSHYIIGTTILGIALVGTMNLVTSFGLAIYVAMKSRKVRYRHWKAFWLELFTALYRQPGRFLLPPSKTATNAAHSGTPHH